MVSLRTMISRREFGLALVASPLVQPVRAQSRALQARIKIDTERVIGDIDPKIYGNFIEHLGRCIDGGIFEERLAALRSQRLSAKTCWRPSKNSTSRMLRWPGGNFSSNYHWRDGIGPRDQRPPRLEMAWGTVESNRFGTHEFLDYTEMLGHRALHLRQPRHRHMERSAAVGGVLQLRRRHRHDAPAQAERPRRALEGQVLGPRQRDGRPLADGPSQRRGLRQVRARSRQADEVDRPEHQADRRRIVQLRRRMPTGPAGTAPCSNI